MARPRSCECGKCAKCDKRARQNRWLQNRRDGKPKGFQRAMNNAEARILAQLENGVDGMNVLIQMIILPDVLEEHWDEYIER